VTALHVDATPISGPAVHHSAGRHLRCLHLLDASTCTTSLRAHLLCMWGPVMKAALYPRISFDKTSHEMGARPRPLTAGLWQPDSVGQ
jgi:hypothetical protein